MAQVQFRQSEVGARRQTAIGLALATSIVVAWIAVHVVAVFVLDAGRAGIAGSLAVVALQCWLSVGLFIVAHDCMHGTLVAGRPNWNVAIGGLCLALYACFDYREVCSKHRLHHLHAGTAGDPDFLEAEPQGFWRWYVAFFAEYFSWTQIAALTAVTWTYVLLLGAPLGNVLLFWALPAVLSSLQLFAFGTYLPHVRGHDQFTDHHRARSNDFPVWLSLLTCFHFGYHHEHHLQPGVPWWKLPHVHAAGAAARSSGAAETRHGP